MCRLGRKQAQSQRRNQSVNLIATFISVQLKQLAKDHSFNFLLSDFFLFVRAALVIMKPNCSQNLAPKMGPPHSPIFGTYGGHFCGRSETRFNGIGGPKLGPPKTQIETQNWCQFLSPSFGTICLPRDAISKYINQSSVPG